METVFQKIRRLGLKLAIKKALGYEAVFNVAYRKMGKGLNEKALTEEFISLSYSDDYWYADPLIFTYNEITYVFMEVFNRNTGKGSIGYSIITQDGISNPIIVIEESYHMSFPFVFEFDNVIYMIPETEANNSLNLYRCVNFPNEWILHQSFETDIKIVDSVLVNCKNNVLKFLASTFDENDVKKSKYIYYRLKKKNNDVFSIVIIDEYGDYDYSNRNGGQIIKQNGNELLVTQRSTPAIYGYSLIFHIINKHSPLSLKLNSKIEIKPNDIRIMGKRNLLGVHTYSRNEQYEIIDYEYLARKKIN